MEKHSIDLELLYVTFETMEHEETTNLAEKNTILDGRRRRRRVVVGGMWN